MAGRPPLYNNCLDFDAKCEEYFELCESSTRPKYTKEGIEYEEKCPKPFLKSGLALHLGLSTESIRRYAENNESPFCAIVKKCYVRIQNDLEMRAISEQGQAAGCIFNLKCNHGFKETNSVELSGKDGSALVPTQVNFLSTKEIKEKLKREDDE